MKRKFCVGLGFAVTAMMALASDVPTNSAANVIVNAKIESSSASVWYYSLQREYKMQASCKFSLNTMAKRVKKPILKLTICYELGDGVRYYTEQCSRTEGEKWFWTRFRSGKMSVEAASKAETEIQSSVLRSVSVDSEQLKLFYPSSTGVPKGSKVIAVRTELWLDGAMLCNDNLQKEFDLLKLGLPKDWYVNRKYPDKIKYEPY